MSEGNGTGVKVLFEVKAPESLGAIRLGGKDHEIKSPRARHLAKFARIEQALEKVKEEDADQHQALMLDFLSLVLPSCPREEIEDLELPALTGTFKAVAKAIEDRAGAKEEALRAAPFADPSSGSGGSGGSASTSS